MNHKYKLDMNDPHDKILLDLFGDDIRYKTFQALGFDDFKAMLLTLGDNGDL